MSNQAIILKNFGGPEAMELAAVAMPVAQPGGAVVRVMAAGVNGMDWKIREGYLRDVMPVQFPVVLGLELAGEITAIGDGSRFAVGDRVFGLAVPGTGAYAQYVAVPDMLLAHTPAALTDRDAAVLPVASLTAWQMLHAAGAPVAGQTILVHGASGGVGTMLLQLAKQLGLTVIATASASSRDHVLALGADRVIDRASEVFENSVADIDLVIDLAGGDAPDRSWPVLREGGVLVSAARPDVAVPRQDGRRGIWFQMQPDAGRLAQVAAAVASGALSVVIDEVVPLAAVPAAIERNRTGHGPGKTIVDFTLA